jgi:oxygen-independent coproporphyrinogen-3 oxidase
VAGVYLSYPFCAQKCTYCNFASGVFPKSVEARYADALRAELKSYQWNWTPETLYWGGGTPGLLDTDVLASLHRLIPGRPWREATIEVAPGGLTSDRIGAWMRAGLNRVSLGVQSFVRSELSRTGRKHTAEVVAHEVRLLRQCGINAINIDLIAGLPGQTAASWSESLGWIERLDPPHVSVYMLEVDEDSRLGKEMLLGGVRYGAVDVPSEEQIAGFYQSAVERLAALGIHRYEISNFARPGSESLHNLKYWRREPYGGFGADAHSFDGALRWQNAESAEAYVSEMLSGHSARTVATEAKPDEERYFLGLRLLEGVRIEPGTTFPPRVSEFLEDGLLEREGDILRLTARGVLLSNEVFQEFLQA